MQGKRIYPDNVVNSFLPGEYGKIGDTWFACTPDGRLGDLSNHEVTEHEDGTITVSPSILVSAGGKLGEWHGYLEHGVWREV
jgi:hypothetical protein